MKSIIYWRFIIGLFSYPKVYTTKELRARQNDALKSSVSIDTKKSAIESTIKDFTDVFGRYKKNEMQEAIPRLYSKDAFLNDRIHSVHGSEDILNYFMSSFEKIHAAEFLIINVVYGEKEVILQWEMKIRAKESSDWMDFLGVSILQFNLEGKIMYHQDYWDYSELLSHLKLLGSVVNYAKSKS